MEPSSHAALDKRRGVGSGAPSETVRASRSKISTAGSGRDNPSHESYVISFEEAFTRAATADIWLNVGMVSSKVEILAADARFANFPVFRNGRIFNNNQVATEMGGNDFWESGTVHPDRILSDLIQLFHPGLLPPAELFYYKEIK